MADLGSRTSCEPCKLLRWHGSLGHFHSTFLRSLLNPGSDFSCSLDYFSFSLIGIFPPKIFIHLHTAILKVDNQQGSTILNRELCAVTWQPEEEGSLEENGYMYMYG